MFKALFKPKWQHKDFAIRKIAVMRLDAKSSEDAKILANLCTDEHIEVRKAAVERITDLSLLLSIRNTDKDNQTKIDSRIVNLLCDKESIISPAQKLEAFASVKTPELCNELLTNSEDTDLILACIEDADNDASLLDLAVNGKTAKVRQAAVNAISDYEKLQQVANLSKGKDKSVYRIAKNSLDQRRELQEATKQEQAECERLCAAIETHSRISVDPLFQAKLHHLVKQWQDLDSTHKPSFDVRFSKAETSCNAIVKAYADEAQKNAIAIEKKTDAANELEEAVRVIEEAISIMQQSSDAPKADVPAFQGVLKTQQLRWQEATSLNTPSASLKSRYNAAAQTLSDYLEACHGLVKNQDALLSCCESIDSLDQKNINDVIKSKKQLTSLLHRISWPSSLQQPESLVTADRSLEKLSGIEDKLQHSNKNTLTKLDSTLIKLEEDIDAGHLKNANKKLKELHNIIKTLPPKDTNQQQQKIRDLSAKLYELRDWQGFATTPKKEQLCNEMEALVDGNKDPQDLADAIKALQDQWKALGRAEPNAERELWARFKTAGDKAYEPCKAYFSQLADVRADNLAKRKQLCVQLNEYNNALNWSGSVDWNNVLEILKTAKQEWRSYSPVERKASQAVQDEFDAALGQIQGRLDHERESNAKKKTALIDQITALAAHENTDHAVNEAKRLQQDWKKIGMVQRKDDQKLWKSFRAACDQVFAQRQLKRDEEEAERDGNKEKAQAVCDALQSFVNEPDEVLINTKGKLKGFKEDFANCQPLPKAVAVQLNSQFDRLSKELGNKVQQAKIQLESASYNRLWEKADICAELEQSILNGSLNDQSLNEFKERWNDAGELPDAAVSAMNARFDEAVDMYALSADESQKDSANKKLTQELAENQEKTKALTIKMEIIAGIESPAEDQKQRMELQVARLSQSMQGSSAEAQKNGSQDSPQSEQEKRSLLIEWCTLGPVSDQETKAYSERFKKAFSV